jgi:drug/metabolite transporter (DMT)-like permease
VTTFLLFLTNAIGGSTYPATTVMLRGFSTRDGAFLRMGLASLLFAPFLWRARLRLAKLGVRDWILLSAVGIMGYALPLVLGIYGQTMASASSAALFIGMEPVSIVVMSCLFLGEKLNGMKLFSLVAGLTGAMLIAFQGLPRLGMALSGPVAGNLILAFAGICWGLYSVLGKPVLSRVEPMDYTAVTTVLCFVGVAAWVAPGLSPSAWRGAGAGAWGAVLYLAVAGSFLGAWIWNVVLREVEASSSANFIFLQPLVGVMLGAGFLGDPMSRWTAIGGALILMGMWAANRSSATD